jgi:hypothetical protein
MSMGKLRLCLIGFDGKKLGKLLDKKWALEYDDSEAPK